VRHLEVRRDAVLESFYELVSAGIYEKRDQIKVSKYGFTDFWLAYSYQLHVCLQISDEILSMIWPKWRCIQ
jgi:hypothetical protein